MCLSEEQSAEPASSTPRLTPAAPKHGALAYHASPTHYSRPAATTPGAHHPSAAANVHRRRTTFHLASRRGRAAPGVLIVPLRGTIGGNGIINPMFDACGAETWGFGISCVSDALLTPCRRDTRRPTIHLPRQTCIEDAQADKAPGFGALLRQTWGKRPPDDNGTSPQLLLKKKSASA